MATRLDSLGIPTGLIVQTQKNIITGPFSVSTGSVLSVSNSAPTLSNTASLFTVSITPASATSTLLVQVWIMMASTAAHYVTCMFKDGVVVSAGFEAGTNGQYGFIYSQISGSISPTTFDIRAGFNSTGVIQFNSDGGSTYGGIFTSGVIVQEITT